MKLNNVIRIVIGAALILPVPLVAMIFTDEMKWDLHDFVIMGLLLVGSGLTFELVSTKFSSKYRPVIAVVCIAAVLLIWAELAVGIFGSPFAGS